MEPCKVPGKCNLVHGLHSHFAKEWVFEWRQKWDSILKMMVIVVISAKEEQFVDSR